jgi:hypothetical protein
MEDNGLLGFTAPQDSPVDNNADPMSFMGDASPPAAGGYSDPFAGVPVKENVPEYSSGIPEQTALREWEDKHNEELEEKSRVENSEKSERRAAATSEIAKWNEERLANVAKKQQTNRSEEAAFAAANKDAPQGATPWERVVDLIDTNQRAADDSRDTSRMRALLIQLKASPPAKAA